jgi:hypothetical protein
LFCSLCSLCSQRRRWPSTDRTGVLGEDETREVEIPCAESAKLANAGTIAEDEDEWSTDSLVRVEGDYFLVHKNGGSRGAHCRGANHFPETLEPTETLSRSDARAVLLNWGYGPAEVARLTS